MLNSFLLVIILSQAIDLESQVSVSNSGKGYVGDKGVLISYMIIPFPLKGLLPVLKLVLGNSFLGKESINPFLKEEGDQYLDRI